mmetsp:Transcript_19310/g.50176  ORF Transcript_19310/g.50176 Transcript_19310/m.50176 type:complete len:92 (-) Transcript_19310:98-373(-)
MRGITMLKAPHSKQLPFFKNRVTRCEARSECFLVQKVGDKVQGALGLRVGDHVASPPHSRKYKGALLRNCSVGFVFLACCGCIRYSIAANL